MAKTTNPFFSFAASGSACGITVHAGRAHHVARRAARRQPGRTAPAVTEHRERVAAAATAWATLTPSQRTPWNAIPVISKNRSSFAQTAPHYNGWLIFLREYLAQNITAPDLPLVPLQ